MEQVTFGFIQRAYALFEVVAVIINVGCASDVEGFEFFRRPNVEDDEICLRQQFLRVVGFDVLDRGGRGAIGSHC